MKRSRENNLIDRSNKRAKILNKRNLIDSMKLKDIIVNHVSEFVYDEATYSKLSRICKVIYNEMKDKISNAFIEIMCEREVIRFPSKNLVRNMNLKLIDAEYYFSNLYQFKNLKHLTMELINDSKKGVSVIKSLPKQLEILDIKRTKFNWNIIPTSIREIYLDNCLTNIQLTSKYQHLEIIYTDCLGDFIITSWPPVLQVLDIFASRVIVNEPNNNLLKICNLELSIQNYINRINAHFYAFSPKHSSSIFKYSGKFFKYRFDRLLDQYDNTEDSGFNVLWNPTLKISSMYKELYKKYPTYRYSLLMECIFDCLKKYNLT